MNNNFFINNRNELYKKIDDNSVLLMFSGKAPHKSNDSYHQFIVNRNFFYITGIEQENTILMVVKKDDNIEEFLFIEEADPILEKWVGKKLSNKEAINICGIDNILYLEKFKDKFNYCVNSVNSFNINNVYFDFSRFNWEDGSSLSENFCNEIKIKYPHLNINNVNSYLTDLRLIKKPEEITCVKEAIKITNKGIEAIMNNVKPDMYEYQLEAYYDFAIKSEGSKNAFDTIAASGKNATILHYISNRDILKEGDLILFDVGAEYCNYSADISRTFPISGKFTKRQKKIYSIVLECMKIVINNMRPGKSMKELNSITRDSLTEGCMKIGLINEKDEISKYFYHGIGHPLGLDTHDVGGRDLILKPGMVLTCEPGLYIEEEGIGIRIEDDILITEEGNINLSEDIIREIDEIENFIRHHEKVN